MRSAVTVVNDFFALRHFRLGCMAGTTTILLVEGITPYAYGQGRRDRIATTSKRTEI